MFRWTVFIFDQPAANAYSYLPLFKNEILNGSGLFHGIMMLVTRAVARPTSQIITGYFNSNLWGKNLKKWSTIGYLNSKRILILTLFNWLVYQSYDHLIGFEEVLRCFNICYYGMVGYLMYIETFTL